MLAFSTSTLQSINPSLSLAIFPFLFFWGLYFFPRTRDGCGGKGVGGWFKGGGGGGTKEKRKKGKFQNSLPCLTAAQSGEGSFVWSPAPLPGIVGETLRSGGLWERPWAHSSRLTNQWGGSQTRTPGICLAPGQGNRMTGKAQPPYPA